MVQRDLRQRGVVGGGGGLKVTVDWQSQVEGSDLRWRGALRGGGEQLKVDESNLRPAWQRLR